MQNPTAARILSIDVFRGITILAMIFVNELAGVGGIPAWLKHMPADADAMSVVDAVFPAFLFIVGMSIPFALRQRAGHGDTWLQLNRHILARTIGLLAVGLFMVNADGGYDARAMPLSIHAWSLLFYAAVILVWSRCRLQSRALEHSLRAAGVLCLVVLALIYRGEGLHGMTIQWWGILGLIGWAYLAGCLCYQLSAGRPLGLLLMTAACLAYSCIAQNAGVMAQPGWSRIFSQPSHAAHVSIVLCGVLTAQIFFGSGAEKNRWITATGLALLLASAAYCLAFTYGIFKIRGTPSWCLYSSALCICMFSLLYWMLDIKQYRQWAGFLQPVAVNPLLAYIIPYIIFAAMQCLGVGLPDMLRHGWPGAAWCIAYALLVLAMVAALTRLNIRLQL